MIGNRLAALFLAALLLLPAGCGLCHKQCRSPSPCNGCGPGTVPPPGSIPAPPPGGMIPAPPPGGPGF